MFLQSILPKFTLIYSLNTTQFNFETHVDLKGEHAEFRYTGRMTLRVVTSVLSFKILIMQL
jgi:hypothetical protein